jgi:hypothetical protein
MVFRPRWPHGRPRAFEDLVGLMSQLPDRLTSHCIGIIEVDFPTTSMCELGERLASAAPLSTAGSRSRLPCFWSMKLSRHAPKVQAPAAFGV